MNRTRLLHIILIAITWMAIIGTWMGRYAGFGYKEYEDLERIAYSNQVNWSKMSSVFILQDNIRLLTEDLTDRATWSFIYPEEDASESMLLYSQEVGISQNSMVNINNLDTRGMLLSQLKTLEQIAKFIDRLFFAFLFITLLCLLKMYFQISTNRGRKEGP